MYFHTFLRNFESFKIGDCVKSFVEGFWVLSMKHERIMLESWPFSGPGGIKDILLLQVKLGITIPFHKVRPVFYR